MSPVRSSALVGAACGLLAFWFTGSRFLIEIDWDNAAHYEALLRLFDGGGGACGYGTSAWTCGYTAHMALVPLYAAGAKVAMFFGGDIFTGLRLVTAAAVAVAAGTLALLVRRLGGSALLAVVAVGGFLFTADVLYLVRTVEDDCIALAWMSVLLYLCVRDGSRFTPPVAAGLGGLLGMAALTNYPMVVWAPVVLAAATVYARPDLPLLDRRRLLLPALVVAGFAAVVVVHGVWVHLLDPAGWPWGRYWAVLGMEPNELASQPGSIGGMLRYVGAHSLATTVRGYPTEWLLSAPGRAGLAGGLLLAAAAFGVLWPLRRGPAGLSLHGRAISLGCLALIVCTLPPAWKNDITFFERMSHVPLCLAVVLVGVSLGARRATATAWWTAASVRRHAALALTALTLVVGVGRLGSTSPSTSWLARFQTIEHRHRDADAYVFAESEFGPLKYDRLASLSIALSNPIILTPTGEAKGWRIRPFPVLSPEEYRQSPPARPYLSEAARAIVAEPPR